jgi:hypothetical protein
MIITNDFTAGGSFAWRIGGQQIWRRDGLGGGRRRGGDARQRDRRPLRRGVRVCVADHERLGVVGDLRGERC